jgi:hypothetical protein
MYGEGLLMMSAWRSKHVELYTYRQEIKIYHKLHLLVYLLECSVLVRQWTKESSFTLSEMVTYSFSVVSKTEWLPYRFKTYFTFNNFFFPKIGRFRDVKKIW